MDSLDAVEVVMEIERTFGIDLPELDASALHQAQLGDLWRLVVTLRGEPEPPPGAPPAADETWRGIVRIVAKASSTPADDVRWDAPLFGGRSPRRSRDEG